MPQDISLFQTIIQQGGIFAALMGVLWFYRRDWRTLTEFWQAASERQIDVIQENTAAFREMKAIIDLMHDTLVERRRTPREPRV